MYKCVGGRWAGRGVCSLEADLRSPCRAAGLLWPRLLLPVTQHCGRLWTLRTGTLWGWSVNDLLSSWQLSDKRILGEHPPGQPRLKRETEELNPFWEKLLSQMKCVAKFHSARIQARMLSSLCISLWLLLGLNCSSLVQSSSLTQSCPTL